MASNANAGKAKTRKSVKDLSPKDMKKVVGGRKAGGDPEAVPHIKLNEVLVSNV